MGLTTNHWQLLQYKIKYIGVLNTLHVACLDLREHLVSQVAKRFPGMGISPRSIQIECTTRCNLKCTFCELSYWKEKPSDLKFESIQKMIGHLPHLRRIDLTGIGESLMNREFFRIVEFLKSRRLYVTLNDNFTLMTERAARKIVELGVDQIFLSLDGATKETFESIRVGSNFEKVIGNTRRLIQIKSELGKRLPEVKINTVVCLSNYLELPQIVELAHDMGIGMIQFVNVITFDNTTDLDTIKAMQGVKAKLKEALERADQLGVLVKTELFDKVPVEGCDFPWKRNFVTYDGYLHPCCYTTQTGDRTTQNGRSFGNLIKDSFKEMWKGKTYSTFRRKIMKGVLPFECQHCPKYFGKRDRELNKMESRESLVVSRE